jgi:hypothetical protein
VDEISAGGRIPRLRGGMMDTERIVKSAECLAERFGNHLRDHFGPAVKMEMPKGFAIKLYNFPVVVRENADANYRMTDQQADMVKTVFKGMLPICGKIKEACDLHPEISEREPVSFELEPWEVVQLHDFMKFFYANQYILTDPVPQQDVAHDFLNLYLPEALGLDFMSAGKMSGMSFEEIRRQARREYSVSMSRTDLCDLYNGMLKVFDKKFFDLLEQGEKYALQEFLSKMSEKILGDERSVDWAKRSENVRPIFGMPAMAEVMEVKRAELASLLEEQKRQKAQAMEWMEELKKKRKNTR